MTKFLCSALLLLASSVFAAPLTRFSPGTQYPIGGPKIRLALDTACSQCESGPYDAGYYSFLQVECHGTCAVQFVCRSAGIYDAPLVNSVTNTDGANQYPVDGACDTAFFQILNCQPTATYPTCTVSAWLY